MVRERFWPLLELHSGPCRPEPAPPRRHADTLYGLSVRAMVSGFSDRPRSVVYRREIERLPVAIRLDALCEMCDHPALVDVLLQLLSGPADFSDLIQCAPSKVVRCLQWLESVQRSLPALLAGNYRQLVAIGCASKRVHCAIRCGLRIGTFLADAGWHVHAVSILRHCVRLTDTDSEEELAALTQLLRALSVCGKFADARPVYRRIRSRVVMALHGPHPPDRSASVYHSFSLYHYEAGELALSYHYGVRSLELLDRNSPARLVWDVLRQLARASMVHRYFSKANLLLDQALARAGSRYGLTSAPYAETLEDYAVYLLALDNVTDSLDAFSVAQHIYLELFGWRNLLLSIAQGSLTFGLCRQAFGMRGRDEAMAYVTGRLNAFRRTMGPDHRLVVQLQRLLVTLRVIPLGDGRPNNHRTIAIDPARLRSTLDLPLPIEAVRQAFHRCQESFTIKST